MGFSAYSVPDPIVADPFGNALKGFETSKKQRLDAERFEWEKENQKNAIAEFKMKQESNRIQNQIQQLGMDESIVKISSQLYLGLDPKSQTYQQDRDVAADRLGVYLQSRGVDDATIAFAVENFHKQAGNPTFIESIQRKISGKKDPVVIKGRLVDSETGQEIYAAPSEPGKPTTIYEGGTLVGPDGKVLYQGKTKTPAAVWMTSPDGTQQYQVPAENVQSELQGGAKMGRPVAGQRTNQLTPAQAMDRYDDEFEKGLERDGIAYNGQVIEGKEKEFKAAMEQRTIDLKDIEDGAKLSTVRGRKAPAPAEKGKHKGLDGFFLDGAPKAPPLRSSHGDQSSLVPRQPRTENKGDFVDPNDTAEETPIPPYAMTAAPNALARPAPPPASNFGNNQMSDQGDPSDPVALVKRAGAAIGNAFAKGRSANDAAATRKTVAGLKNRIDTGKLISERDIADLEQYGENELAEKALVLLAEDQMKSNSMSKEVAQKLAAMGYDIKTLKKKA